MKKLFLGLMATVFVCSMSAQTKLSSNQKSVIDAQMISLVHFATATTYQKGMSQADFLRQTGPVNPTKDETTLLQKMYKYVSEGTTDCDIMKADNSILVAVTQSGTISQTPPEGKFPWKALLEIVVEIIKVVIESIP